MTNRPTALAELPKYEPSREAIWALRIKKSVINTNGTVTLSFLEKFTDITLAFEIVEQIDPRENGRGWDSGYYVVYEGGIKNWIEAEEFEENYILTNE